MPTQQLQKIFFIILFMMTTTLNLMIVLVLLSQEDSLIMMSPTISEKSPMMLPFLILIKSTLMNEY